MNMKKQISIPEQAQVVIVGGGVIGCSVAYHLTKLGWKDVVVVERDQLTSGTTWHAAGLIVSSGFETETSLEIAKYTRELYSTLEQETGLSTGFKPIGFLQVANNRERMIDLKRKSLMAQRFGINSEEVSAAQARELWPMGDMDDVLGGFYSPDDGRANPVDVTMSLAKGARMGGARICEGVTVTGITQHQGRATGVETTIGNIKAEYVVNCAGMWARELGSLAGVNVPLQAAEHYYLITGDIEGIRSDLPVLEDPDRYAYYREEVGGMMVGLFEPMAAPWALDGIPNNFTFGEINPDWDRLMPYLEKALERVPLATEAGVRKFFCGPESFTPDLSPIVGEAPELQNFFVAAGLNSLGILSGGGIGRLLAHWIVNGRPDMDVTELNIDRFQPFQSNRKYRKDRTPEMLGEMYSIHYPNKHVETARNAKQSVLHERLVAAGAHFGESAGWEIADWYAPAGIEPKVEEYRWDRQNWFDYHAAEHRACREAVSLLDMSFMSKFLVQGRDAESFLNQVCCNDIAVTPGHIVYTQWTNENGGIEADLTVSRLSQDKFMVVCADVSHRHVETWMQRHVAQQAHVFITDVTSSYTHLNLHGPNSRELLNELTNEDMSNEAFPFLSLKEIDIGYARVIAVRVTYVGELGWELYIPTEHAVQTYDRIVAAGEQHGLKHIGLQALMSLRLEKGYRDYGHDIDNMDTPLEAGLGFAVKLDKPGGFIGRDALQTQKDAGIPNRRLLQFQLLDSEPLLSHGETIFRNGESVGYIRAGAYGFTLGAAVGLGFVESDHPVTKEYIDQGEWEIQVVDQRYPAKPSLRPLYDPNMERIKC